MDHSISDFVDKDGNERANLGFHANDIKIHAKGKGSTNELPPWEDAAAPAAVPASKDDLPF